MYIQRRHWLDYCHLAIEGERDPVRLHDRALGELIPANEWRELS